MKNEKFLMEDGIDLFSSFKIFHFSFFIGSD